MFQTSDTIEGTLTAKNTRNTYVIVD